MSQSSTKQQSSSVEVFLPSVQKKATMENLLYNLKSFPITISITYVFTLYLISFMFFVNMLDFYSSSHLALFNREIGSFLRLDTFISSSVTVIICALNIVMSLVVALSIYFTGNNTSGVLYFFEQISKNIFPLSRLCVDILFVLGGFTLLTGLPIAIVTFVINSLLTLVTAAVHHNYVMRKDFMCCKSFQFLVLWKFIMVLGFITNSFGTNAFITNTVTIFGLAIGCHLIMAIVLYVSYFTFGVRVYRHWPAKIGISLFISFYFAFSFVFVFDSINYIFAYGQNFSQQSLSVSLGSMSLLTFLLTYQISNHIQAYYIGLESTDAVKKKFFTMTKLQQSQTDIESDCIIRGLLRAHIIAECDNPHCMTHRLRNFDNKKKKQVSFDAIRKDKISLTKLYIKCVLENHLEKNNWDDLPVAMEFAEFLFIKLRNALMSFKVIHRLLNRQLSPFGLLRMVRLKKVIKEESEVMKKEWPNQLDFQNVIMVQQNFAQLCQMIQVYLRKTSQFWSYIQNSKVNISQMRRISDDLFEFKTLMNEKWKNVSKYLDHNSRWKFYYVCYTLYIRNEKIRYQFIEEFGMNVNYDQLFSPNEFEEDPKNRDGQLESATVFDHDCCLIQARWEEDSLIIKKISSCVENVFGYEKEEILESQLNILMPATIRSVHNEVFQNWTENKSNNPESYRVRKIYPITKKGYLIGGYLQFKQFVSTEHELQYVGVLKLSSKEQATILVNKHFEIEAITKSAATLLEIPQEFVGKLKDFNILSFMVSIIRSTVYADYLARSPNSHRVMSEIKELVSKLNSTFVNDTASRSNKNSFAEKGVLRSECQFIFSHDLVRSIEIYAKMKMGKTNDAAIYRALEAVFLQNQGKQWTDRYKCQFVLTRHTLLSGIYYDLTFISLENLRKSGLVQEDERTLLTYTSPEDAAIREHFNANFAENLAVNSQISIMPTNNIFIKQQSNQAQSSFYKITFIIIVIRILFVLMVSILIFTRLKQQSAYSDLARTVQEYKVVVQIKKLTLDVYVHYQQANFSMNTDLDTDIVKLTMDALAIYNNQTYKQLLFNTAISGNNKYPSAGNSPEHVSFDKIDLGEVIFGTIISLKDGCTAQIKTAKEYLVFKNNIIPGYNRLTDELIVNLNSLFAQQTGEIEFLLMLMVGISGILIFISMIAFSLSIIRAISSFRALIELYVQLDDFLVRKIEDYIHEVTGIFKHLNEKNEEKSRGIKEKSIKLRSLKKIKMKAQTQEQQAENRAIANLNKKAKQIEEGKVMRSKKFKPIFLFVLGLIVYGGSNIYFNFYKRDGVAAIVQFFNSGFRLPQFSLPNIILAAMTEKFYSPNTFNIQYFNASLTLQSTINANDRVVVDTVNTFSTMQLDMLTDDFCKLYPQILPSKFTLARCHSLISNQLQNGIYGGMSYINKKSSYFLLGSTSITSADLLEMADAVQIMNPYLDKLVEEWDKGFNEQLNSSLEKFNIFFAIIIVLLVLIHVLFVENFIIAKLNHQYTFYRDMYEHMMPEFVVESEKTIKARLQVEGFLRK